MKNTKNILSFSGGKDSTALLIMMLDRKIRVDEVVFIDTGVEFPAMYKHIEKIEKNYGLKITRLNFPNTFEFYMLNHIKTKGKNIGSKGYGWCGKCRWGTTIKKQIFAKYVKEKYNNQIVEFQGIASDEKERLKKNQDKKWELRYPLAEWGIAEAQALKLCYSLGYTWGGLYNHMDRVSCWCCQNNNLKELKFLYKCKPKLWAKLKEYDQQIISLGLNQYRNDYTLKQLETRFNAELFLEENQMKMF